MASPSELKDHFRETRLFTQRAVVALALTVLLLGVLIARLVNLQIFEHNTYAVLSDKNRVHIRAVAPTRGLIYDRNGVILAENLPSYRLEIVPEQVDDMESTLAELGKLIAINEDNLKDFRQRLKNTRRYQAIPLRSRLSDEEVARIAVNRHRFPGVDTVAHLYRHYPQGALGVHALGYVGRINENDLQRIDNSNYEGSDYIGKTGLEKFYEDLLHGEVGVQRVETNAQGRAIRVLETTPPVPGLNLHLSLDVELQRIAETAMGDNNGALVAIDPSDGSMVALASMPTFDPNLFVGNLDVATFHELRDSINQPLFNRATRGRYPPGSTIKPLIGLAGLEYGVTTSKRSLFCPGWYSLNGNNEEANEGVPKERRKYRDWKKTGHGRMDLGNSIVQSCDVYFYDLALNLGIDRLSHFMEPFGFNDVTGLDISDELAGLIPSRQWKRRARQEPWYLGETLITGIGQGFFLVTPLQLATAVGALSRYGQQLRPHLVSATEDPASNERIGVAAIPNTTIPIVDRNNWDYIIRAMTRVVHSARGTARRIGKNAPYKIAGKTGTAQVFGIKQDEEYVAEDLDKRLRDHALFVAFAPVENPRIAIAVIVENGGSGGAVAAPIARKVMDHYLASLETGTATAEAKP